MNEIEERPAIDLLDFCFLTAGAACPPLLLLAVGQWVLRRNQKAVQWLEGKAARLIEDRLGLPAPTPTPLALPAPAQTAEANADLLPMLAGSTHLLVVGHTGGGKTNLLHGLARHLSRDATVIVCDPESMEGQYPGYQVVGAADDYDAISAALVSVHSEVVHRREQRRQGQRTFPPLWVLCDEVHDIIHEIDGAWDILEDLIRRGRKLNIHCAIGSQDAQVKSLGLEGKSKLLDNLVRVDVRVRDDQRVAVIDGVVYEVPHLPDPDDTVKKSGETAETDPLLSALLGSVSGSSKPQTAETSKPVYAVSNRFSKPPETTSETNLQTAIRARIADGHSKNQVADWLKVQYGIGNKVKAYEIINAALDRSEQSGDDDPPAPFGFLA